MAVEIRRSTLWIIAILVILNIVSIGALWLTRERKPVFDISDNRGRGMNRERGHMIARQLDLTPEQLQKFDSLNVQHRRKIRDKTIAIREMRSSMLDYVDKGVEDSVQLLAAEIGKMHEELELMNYQHFQNVFEICNETQKEKFLDIVEGAIGKPHHRGRMRRFRGDQ